MKNLSGLFEGGTKELQRKKRTTFYVICATLALLAALLLFLIGFTVISNVVGNKPEQTEEPETTVSIGETTTVTFGENELYSGNLLLLDATHTYNGTPAAETFPISGERPQAQSNAMYTVQSTSLGATEETINAFHNMVKAFYEKSKDDNLIVYDAYDVSSDSNDPVFSAGTAIELKYFSAADAQDWTKRDSIQGVDKYKWIYSNAAKYGFVNIPVDGQTSNIFRYVGVEHALAMTSSKLSFNAYLEHLKTSTSPEKPLSVKSGSSSYAVYYLSATGEHVVPVNYSYTVSGNNADGYIITVNLSSTTAQ